MSELEAEGRPGVPARHVLAAGATGAAGRRRQLLARGPASSATAGPERPSRALAASLVLGVLFAVLAGTVLAEHGAPIGLDLPLHRWALRNRQATVVSAAVALTTTGTGVPAYLVAALAGATGRSGRASRWRSAALAAVALAAGEVIRVALVVWVGRPRPPAADWAWHAGGAAFPSGHTTSSALVAVIVCLAVRRVTVRPRRRVGWCAVALLWAAGVGGTRIYLGMHWPTDVLAGWLLAGCLALAALALPWRGRIGRTSALRPPPVVRDRR